MAQILDGKELSQRLRQELFQKAAEFEKKYGRKIGLAVVLVEGDGASEIYVRNKISACEQTNIKSFAYYLPQSVSFDELCALIQTLNQEQNVDGILVQLPLPKHIDERAILQIVDCKKDVDGFNAQNAGNLVLGNDCLKSCTPSGCMELIKMSGVSIEGKNAVVVGRSNIVGKPAALLLLEQNATVTICHSRTKNLKEVCQNADILIAAVGKPKLITADMVKQGAVVIDVGMNRDNGKLCGDVDFEGVSKKAGFITPVPGGVGPMTITMLLANVIKAAFKNAKNSQ